MLTVDFFLTAWKATSIVLTGAFGVLGLVKDFKDKTGKITKWGRISLAGILLSTGFGVVAQLIESSKAARTEKDTAKQTLGIVQDIQRGLAPLDAPTFDISLSLDCTNLMYEMYCEKMKSLPNSSLIDRRANWKYWPNQLDGKASLFLKINFFVNRKDADLYLKGKLEEGDLSFLLKPTSFDDSLSSETFDGEVFLSAHQRVEDFGSNGRLRSILDIKGVTVVAVEFAQDSGVRKMLSFRMKFKNGQSFSYGGPFEEVKMKELPACRFTLSAPD